MTNLFFNSSINQYKFSFFNPDTGFKRKPVNFYGRVASNDVYERKNYCIDSSLREDLSSLEYSYKQIKSILDKKNGEGVKRLIQESGLFNTSDGLTFKNVGIEKDNIAFDAGCFKNLSNTVRITQKSPSGKVKRGWLIQDNKVVKNYNPLNPNALSNKAEFYTSEELKKLGINEELKNIIEDLDPVMLKVRQLVVAHKDMYLKTEAPLDSEVLELLDSINELYSKVSCAAEQIPQSTLYKMNVKYPNYKQISGQSSYTFQNLGGEKEQINYSTINSLKYGELKRIIVYDCEGKIKTGYLIKDNKIVSNFNPQNPTILPEKFYYADENDVKNQEYSKDLPKYLQMYEKELSTYLEFLTPDNKPGILVKEYADTMDSICKKFESIETMFAKMSNVLVSHTKTQYDDYVNLAGKRGYTFRNTGRSGENLNIMRCNTRQNSNIMKISVIDDQGDIKDFLLVQNGNVISNFNPKYPTLIPPVLKFYNQQDLDNLSALSYLVPLNEKMTDFEKFVCTTLENKEKNKKIRMQRESMAEKNSRNIQPEKLSDSSYKKLLRECQNDFKKGILELKRDKASKENFIKILDDIRNKVENYFSD